MNVENLCENPFRPTRDFRCGQIRVRQIFHKKFKIQSVVVAKCHLIIILPKNYYPEDKKHEKTAIFPFLGFDWGGHRLKEKPYFTLFFGGGGHLTCLYVTGNKATQ